MKSLFIALFTFLIWSCNNTKTATSEGEPVTTNAEITFENKSHDFGELTEGEVVSHTYSFTNTGTDPLEIFAVNVSCGCTVAEKPEKPVGVGQKSEIKINFNTEGKNGANSKSIQVVSNAKNNLETLNFTAVVNGKEETKE